MAGVNRVTLLGNLGTAPEVRRTPKQTAVCRFRLATSERRMNADGAWIERAEWHNVVVFGKTAENCGAFLSKGRQVYVEGSLRTRSWQDPEGQMRHATEVVASNVQFVGGRGKGGQPEDETGHEVGEEHYDVPGDVEPMPGFDESDTPF